jgi:hypothetical protein
MKKLLSLVLSVFLLHAFSLASLATDSSLEKSKRALLASKVKAAIAQLGTGESSVVRVVLYDKSKYHGYITEVGEDSFVVADAKTGATASIAFPEVKGIKGSNFSTGTKIGIGVGIAAAIAVIVAVVANGDDEKREQPSPCTAQVGVPCPPGCPCIQ